MTLSPSPLRYPGGKAKLYSMVKTLICLNLRGNNRVYIEPFAGGAGLALKLLFNNDVDRLILNDIDYRIYCFWYSCLYNTSQLCEMIENCEVNIDTWRFQRSIYSSPDTYSMLEVGFATFFLNRCNVSGIIQGGPIGGMDQLGTYCIDARFNKKNLLERIKRIGEVADKIKFYNMDALYFLQHELPKYSNGDFFLNIDPPYVKKGKLLYENSFTEDNHSELCNVIKTLNYKWIVTYDECDLVYNLYKNYRKYKVTLNYSAGKTKSGKELLILGDNIITS